MRLEELPAESGPHNELLTKKLLSRPVVIFQDWLIDILQALAELDT